MAGTAILTLPYVLHSKVVSSKLFLKELWMAVKAMLMLYLHVVNVTKYNVPLGILKNKVLIKHSSFKTTVNK